MVSDRVPDFLSHVLAHATPGQVAAVVEMPARASAGAPWPEWVAPEVKDALANRGIRELWSHQAEAAELLHGGAHTVVATGTGSGKSLAAWIPALDLLSRRGRGRSGLANIRYRPSVLYLAPTKALAADQLVGLARLAREVDPRIGVAAADGDAEASVKRWAREYADVVLSNPDFLQHAMLASHERWARLWRGLAMVVMDEFHSYRGVFGANVAATVRRLLRLAAHYGACPAVAFLSATSGDPAETARRFLGDSFGPVQAVERDGSPRGPKRLVLWRCREVEGEQRTKGKGVPRAEGTGLEPRSDAGAERHAEPQSRTGTEGDPRTGHDAGTDFPGGPRRAANTEAGELTGVLAAAGAQTLTFVRSRAGAERVAEIARDWSAANASGLDPEIAAYRGGYLPEDRRALEDSLRSGELRALATTNALELGIDVSGLDAVVVTGWPGTHASFAQQIGRAGRAGKPGVAVFIGRDDPLDQYLLSHPEAFTQSPAETNVFDPANPHVLLPHVCAAAAELPLTESDAEVFGLDSPALFDDLASDGLLRRRPNGWFWNASLGADAHDMVSLRGEGGTVSIVDGESGVLLGTVDSARADATVFPGAVYLHQGVPYMVESLDEDAAVVHRHREEEIRTYAAQSTSVHIVDIEELAHADFGVWARGEVLVTSQVTGYDIRRSEDGLYLGRVPLDMPVRELRTSGTWWTLDVKALERAGVSASDLPGALHAAEHTSIGILPLLATCDRWDLGGLSTVWHADTQAATVIVHDAVPGGSGCSLHGFEHGRIWMEATLAALESCPCTDGCPRCVQSPKCGNNNEPLSKGGATKLLRVVVDGLRRAGA